ncbi:DJ-1/PfpI family protein [Streptomyces sp. 184]|uniref:DJ-1/PfpI family protein n=1 Tax=Streptomyces sp. 184 TaxID=1827526 RepID=UPI003892C876
MPTPPARRSDLVDPWYELRLCAAQPGPLTTAPGLLLQSPYGLGDLAEADTVLIPGLTRSHQLDPPPGLVAAVRKAYEAGRRIVALCAGAYVPAAAGVRQWGYPRQ